MIKGCCVKQLLFYFRPRCGCTNVLGLDCKGAAILEINKQTMKTNNIRKLVQTNYVTNVYKNRDCPGSVADFLFSLCAKTVTVGAYFDSRLGNQGKYAMSYYFFRFQHYVKTLTWACISTIV